MASTLSNMKISITKQMRAMRDVMMFMVANGVNFHTVQQLREELEYSASFFPSTVWGGDHGYIPLVFSHEKMRVVANNDHLDCSPIKTPELLNPTITTGAKGRDLLKLQEEHLSMWASFVYQKVHDQVGIKTIVTNVEEQYIKPL